MKRILTTILAASLLILGACTMDLPLQEKPETDRNEIELLGMEGRDISVWIAFKLPEDEDLEGIELTVSPQVHDMTTFPVMPKKDLEKIKINDTYLLPIIEVLNDTEYTFTVKTVYRDGIKSKGVTGKATPSAFLAPVNLKAFPGDGTVTLTWEKPSPCRWDSIEISYEYPSDNIVSKTISAEAVSYEVVDLVNGNNYTFNINGNSLVEGETETVSIDAVPAAEMPPLPVGNLKAEIVTENPAEHMRMFALSGLFLTSDFQGMIDGLLNSTLAFTYDRNPGGDLNLSWDLEKSPLTDSIVVRIEYDDGSSDEFPLPPDSTSYTAGELKFSKKYDVSVIVHKDNGLSSEPETVTVSSNRATGVAKTGGTEEAVYTYSADNASLVYLNESPLMEGMIANNEFTYANDLIQRYRVVSEEMVPIDAEFTYNADKIAGIEADADIEGLQLHYTWAYSYDSEGRLESITVISDNNKEYKYDALYRFIDEDLDGKTDRVDGYIGKAETPSSVLSEPTAVWVVAYDTEGRIISSTATNPAAEMPITSTFEYNPDGSIKKAAGEEFFIGEYTFKYDL